MSRKTIPTQVRKKVLEKFGNKCAYCGTELTTRTLKVDHIHPVFKGGEDEIENLNPACHWCNHYKTAMDIEQFRQQMLTFHERLEKYANFNLKLGLRYGIAKIEPWDGRFYFEKLREKSS